MIFKIYCRVTGLIDNHDYEFRVAAVNAAGQGPWSSSSDMIRCCAPPSKLLEFIISYIFSVIFPSTVHVLSTL